MSRIVITITSDHADAITLARRALENYAIVNRTIAATSRTRPLQLGETREQLERRALVHDARATAVDAMAEQLPGGQAGTTTTKGTLL